MDNEKFAELTDLIKLYGFLDKAQEMIQRNDLIGGHRSYNDDMLNDMLRELYGEIEKLKEDLK